jgi:hypothetical protein
LIKSFTTDPDLTGAFVDFEYEIYADDPQWIAPLHDRRKRDMLETSIRRCSSSGSKCRHFIATADGRPVGRISAFLNPDLKDVDGTQLGALGSYECVDDAAVAEDLIGAALDWIHRSQGLTRTWGPLDYSIWDRYRFMTEGFGEDPFYGEPYNKPWYPEQFDRAGFEAIREWASLDASDPGVYDRIYERGHDRYFHFVDQGFRFRPFSRLHYGRDFRTLYDLLVMSYARFPGVTNLTFDQFAERFGRLKLGLEWRTSGFVDSPEGDPVGFVITFRDLAAAFRSIGASARPRALGTRLRFLRGRRRSDRLIAWLVGIADLNRRELAGLGRSMAYWTYLSLRKIQPKRYLLGLMASDGYVLAYTRVGGRVTRRYALYQHDADRSSDIR